MQTQEMSLHSEDLTSSWGLPPGPTSLRGGISSLNNNGTSGWGAPPSGTSGGATGWGAPPGSGPPISGGGPGVVGSSSSSPPCGGISGQTNQQPSANNNNHPGGSNQWGSPSSIRVTTSQNTNGQPTISGSQMNNNPTNATNIPPSGSGSMQGQSVVVVGVTNGMVTPNSPMNPGSCTNPNVGGGCSGGIITNSGTSSWAQAAGKSLQSSGNTPLTSQHSTSGGSSTLPTNNSQGLNPNPSIPTQMGGITTPSTTSSVTSKQIELLNSMRDALFSTDGWGGQNVNQDSGWDVPGSPEPHHKDVGLASVGSNTGGGTGPNNGSASWKVPVNNGTDLWEANLRGGGAPPPQPITQKVPWGHTPTTNHGGTWGEEDESDSSNVWNAIPAAGPANPNPPPNPSQNDNNGASRSGWMGGSNSNGPQAQIQQPQQPIRDSANPLWSTPQSQPIKKEPSDWNSIGSGGSVNGAGSSSWGGGGGGSGGSDRGSGDRGRGMNNGQQMDQGMWNKPPPQQQTQIQGGWGGTPNGPSGDVHLSGGVGHQKEKGWDEMSPPAQRRVIPNVPNYDDGTSLWGSQQPQQQHQQPQQQQQQQQQRGMSGNNRGIPNKMDPNPLWPTSGNPNQNRNGWQNQGPPNIQQGLFNGSGEQQHGGWNDEKVNNSWVGEGQLHQQQQHSSWAKPKTPTTAQPGNQTGWGDDGLVDTSNWGQSHKNSKYLNGKSIHHKEFWTSGKPSALQLLSDMSGLRKEDIDQLALRASSMHLSDAIDNLDMGVRSGQMETLSGGGPWGMSGSGGGPMQRRGGPPDDHFDMGMNGPNQGGPFMNPGGRGSGNGGNGGFPSSGGGFLGGGNSLSGNMMNPNHGQGGMNHMIQKMLSQQQQQQPPPQQQQQQPPPSALQFPFNSNNVRGQPNNSPSSQQLKMLVQQIQMAVQAGYLNSQILQHPLPPQSLYLLNQLLQQIKIFQQLSQAQHQLSKNNTNSTTALQLNVQITKTKQLINNLHNQISAQQAMHAKEQQQQQHQSRLGNQPGNSDFYSKNGGDPMLSLQSNFGGQDFSGLKDGSSGGPLSHPQTSRLTQWTRVPSLEKEDLGGDFSRAPGPQTNNTNTGGILKNNSSLILGQSDNTWSTGVQRSGGDGWPTDPSNSTSNDDTGNKVQLGADFGSFGDLVPEFEPGKPWKGNSILKSVEDDPTLTPGSVVRSPLSLAAIKDASEIFNKPSQQPPPSATDTLTTPLSLSSNTWSFTPAGTSSTTMANSMAKLNTKSWGDEMGSSRPRDPWEYGNSGGSLGGGGGNRPPPGMGLPQKNNSGGGGGNNSNNANFGSQNPNPSFNSYRGNSQQQSQHQQHPTGASWGSNPGNGHYWLLLRNLTPQIDGSTLKTLCQQHGPLTKFHLYLNHGIALVKYSTQVTQTAQNALNNCVLGNTTILAETASETDVFTLMQGLNGATPPQSSNNSGFGSGSKGSENPWGVTRNPSKGSGGWGDVEHRDNSPLWTSPWGSSTSEVPDRSTPSSLNNLLPGDLLGGESA